MRLHAFFGLFLLVPHFAQAVEIQDRASGVTPSELTRLRDQVDTMMVENALRAIKTTLLTAQYEVKRAEGDVHYQRQLYDMEKAVFDRGASTLEAHDEAWLKLECAKWKLAEFQGKERAALAEVSIWEMKLLAEQGKATNPVSLAEAYTSLWKARLDTARSETTYFEHQQKFWTDIHARRVHLHQSKASSREDVIRALAMREDMRHFVTLGKNREAEVEGFWKDAMKDLDNAKNAAAPRP